MQKRAIDATGMTHEALSKVLRVSRESVTKYASREREMPPKVRARLAAFLRDHSKSLAEMAEELDKSVD